jgi:hypothetical protein
LTELVQIERRETLPVVIGGDFNILRGPDEKNKGKFELRWAYLFNTVINGLNLKEIEMSGRKFAWANNLPNPMYEKLDRVLVATEWVINIFFSMVVALNYTCPNVPPGPTRPGPIETCLARHGQTSGRAGLTRRAGPSAQARPDRCSGGPGRTIVLVSLVVQGRTIVLK